MVKKIKVYRKRFREIAHLSSEVLSHNLYIQCDQIIQICVQFCPFYNNETLPNNIHYFAKVGSQYCPKLN